MSPLRLPIPPLRRGWAYTGRAGAIAHRAAQAGTVSRRWMHRTGTRAGQSSASGSRCAVPATGKRLEDAAAAHLATVDVQETQISAALALRMAWYSCGRIRLPAEPGNRHGAALFKAVAVAILLEQLVLGDLQAAGDDAFHAPQPGVVVDRRALARPPGHGNDAVAQLRAMVDLPPGVTVAARLEDRRRQDQALFADQAGQGLAQGLGEFATGPAGNGIVQAAMSRGQGVSRVSDAPARDGLGLGWEGFMDRMVHAARHGPRRSATAPRRSAGWGGCRHRLRSWPGSRRWPCQSAACRPGRHRAPGSKAGR